jgi:hypothetical protein
MRLAKASATHALPRTGHPSSTHPRGLQALVTNLQSSVLARGSVRSRALLIPCLMLAFAILVVARMPFALIPGRFWAEDGAVYFPYAWSHGWLDTLFAEHIGYLSVVPNVATLLAARFASLEAAATVTAAVALLIQLLPPVLLLVGAIPWLRHPLTFVAAFALTLAPPGVSEIWLNTATSQFHLMLCVGIVLGSEARTGRAGLLQCGCVALAALSGPGPTFAAPLFVFRTLLDRSAARGVQAALLTLGAMLQIVTHLYAPPDIRQIGMSPSVLVAVIYIKHILLPLFGDAVATRLTVGYPDALMAGLWPRRATLLVILVFGALFVAAFRVDRRHALWFALCGAWMALLSYTGAIGDKSLYLVPTYGARHAYAPTVLFSLSVLGLFVRGGSYLRLPAALVLTCLLVTGATSYFEVPPIIGDGPDWRQQAAAWCEHPDHPLLIWPTGWLMLLTPPPTPLLPSPETPPETPGAGTH